MKGKKRPARAVPPDALYREASNEGGKKQTQQLQAADEQMCGCTGEAYQGDLWTNPCTAYLALSTADRCSGERRTPSDPNINSWVMVCSAVTSGQSQLGCLVEPSGGPSGPARPDHT